MIPGPASEESDSTLTGLARGYSRTAFALPAGGRGALRQIARALQASAVDHQRRCNHGQGSRENYSATCQLSLRTRFRQRGLTNVRKGRRVAGVTGGSVSAGGLTRLLALCTPKSSSVRLARLALDARRGSDNAEHAGQIFGMLFFFG